MRIITSLALALVATVSGVTDYTPITTFDGGPDIKFIWDNSKKAIKVQLANVQEDSKFDLFWNSKENLQYTEGKFD